MKRLVPGAVLLVLACAAGCSIGRDGDERKTADSPASGPVAVLTAKAQRRPLVERLALSGTVVPDQQVTLYAKVSGYLKSVRVDIGDRVRGGRLIATLDVPEIETALSEKRAASLRAEAALEQAQASVDQTRAEAVFAELNYKRLKSIYDRDPDVLPAQDVDQANAGFGVAGGKLKSANAQVRAAEAALAAARAEAATVEAMIRYARVVSPIDGVITRRFVDPGELIQAGSASRGQAVPVVSIAQLDRLRVVIDVPEPSVLQVRTGTKAVVRVEGREGEPIAARVARIAGALDPSSRTMRAEIDLANPEQRIQPGMSAKVELELESMQDAVTVPIGALRLPGGERSVFVIQGHAARQVKVKTGLESPDWIQIVDGLRGGEEVVVSSAGLLKDGAAVRVSR